MLNVSLKENQVWMMGPCALFSKSQTDSPSLGQFAFHPVTHRSYLSDEHFEDPYRVVKWQDSNPRATHTHKHTPTWHKNETV